MMMKLCSLLLLLLFALTNAAPHIRAPAVLNTSNDVKDLFDDWMKDFGVDYKTVKEFMQRLEIWTENHCKSLLNIVVVVVEF